MKTVDSISVDISVVLGSASMPIHQMLRMGRGAVIQLDATEEDDCTILANNIPVARGQVILRGDRVAISITEMLNRAADFRGQSAIQRLKPGDVPDAAREERAAEEVAVDGQIDHDLGDASEDANSAIDEPIETETGETGSSEAGSTEAGSSDDKSGTDGATDIEEI